MVELPPPPPEYVWPEEGEAIEVEAAEDGGIVQLDGLQLHEELEAAKAQLAGGGGCRRASFPPRVHLPSWRWARSARNGHFG